MAKLVIEKVLDALSNSFDAKQEAVRLEILKSLENSLPGITKKYLDELFSSSGNDPVASNPATTKFSYPSPSKENGVNTYSFSFNVMYVVPSGILIHKYAELLVGLLTRIPNRSHPGGKSALFVEGGTWFDSNSRLGMQLSVQRPKLGDKVVTINASGVFYLL